MEIRKNSYFISILALHAETYFLFGVLEKAIRVRITSTLNTYSRQKGYEEWILLVPNSLKGDAALRRALKENMYLIDGLEEFLPFSFWRYLITRQNYTLLWVPALYRVFSNINNPKSLEALHEIQENMREALEIRNRFAHYNFTTVGKADIEKLVIFNLLEKIEKGLAFDAVMAFKELRV